MYGLNSTDVLFQQMKIDKQKDYQGNSTFVTKNGTVKTLLDVSMSANISERYYAQLVNKVNTLQQAMSNLNLIPVFLTITLDGWLHDLHSGDYSRFTLDNQKILPNNSQYGEFQEWASNRETFTTERLYKLLRWRWDKFLKTRTFLNMRKESQIGYLFATEPHESGVPHAHVLLYVPAQYVTKLKEDFKRIFDAPMNTSQDRSRLSPDQIKRGELNGFQWTISNPVGYILKYVTKSFMDIKNQAQIDELQAWYIKHKIIRFTTSHTLVPQWVYNKIYPLENDWLYLTGLKINSLCEWSAEDDYFKFEDTNLNKTFLYQKGLYQVFQDGELIREFGEMKEEKVQIQHSTKYRDKYVLKQHKKTIKIEVFNAKGQRIDLYPTPVPYRSNFDLMTHYIRLNPETCNLQHFGLVQNECIKRGLIKGEIQSLDLFSTDIVSDRVNPFEHEFKALRTHYCIIGAVNSLSSLIPYLNQGA